MESCYGQARCPGMIACNNCCTQGARQNLHICVFALLQEVIIGDTRQCSNPGPFLQFSVLLLPCTARQCARKWLLKTLLAVSPQTLWQRHACNQFVTPFLPSQCLHIPTLSAFFGFLLVHAGKSRGYGFIEFEDKKDMKEAYKSADGRKIEGRRVLVDVERGRTVETW